jgi:hypothetical protein
MPLEMDSRSLDVNHYVIAPQMIIINGDTVMSNGQNVLNCCSFLAVSGMKVVTTITLINLTGTFTALERIMFFPELLIMWLTITLNHQPMFYEV